MRSMNGNKSRQGGILRMPLLAFSAIVFFMAVTAEHVKADEYNVPIQCTLAEAINFANASPGPHTINISPGHIEKVNQALPDITANVKIFGNNSSIRPGPTYTPSPHIINVSGSDGKLFINDISIEEFEGTPVICVNKNNYFEAHNLDFSNNETDGADGLIRNNGGTAKIYDSQFEYNYVWEGGLLVNRDGGSTLIEECKISRNGIDIHGGIFFNTDLDSIINLVKCVVSENWATFAVPGVFNTNDATAKITGGEWWGQVAHETGPSIGLTENGAQLDITNVNIHDNTAGEGTVVNKNGTLNVFKSHFSGNQGSWAGTIGQYGSESDMNLEDDILRGGPEEERLLEIRGGVANIEGCDILDSPGGGMSIDDEANVTMLNSTVSGNSTPNDGGGADINDAVFNFHHNTFSNNSAPNGSGGAINVSRRGTGFLGGNIFSGDSALYGNEISVYYTNVNVNSIGYNIIGTDGNNGINGYFIPDTADFIPPPGVLTGDIITSLGDNGGPTLTHALVPKSPAINFINIGSVPWLPNSDQRGVVRPQGDGFDAGAFEKVYDLDFDNDGDVDGLDLNLFSFALGTSIGDPNYNGKADIDNNGSVDADDVEIFCEVFAEVRT
ncbi:MAG: hypothetical protein GY699_03150 [Desulfobacteraceae bacterium]|nr:hypothetical protein [Desulfobacteraceae bacterium]